MFDFEIRIEQSIEGGCEQTRLMKLEEVWAAL